MSVYVKMIWNKHLFAQVENSPWQWSLFWVIRTGFKRFIFDFFVPFFRFFVFFLNICSFMSNLMESHAWWMMIFRATISDVHLVIIDCRLMLCCMRAQDIDREKTLSYLVSHHTNRRHPTKCAYKHMNKQTNTISFSQRLDLNFQWANPFEGISVQYPHTQINIHWLWRAEQESKRMERSGTERERVGLFVHSAWFSKLMHFLLPVAHK